VEVERLVMADLGLEVVGFFFVDFFFGEPFDEPERVLFVVVDVVVDFVAVGFLGLAAGFFGVGFLGLAGAFLVVVDLAGDFDLDRVVEVFFFFRFNFSIKTGVTLYEALILVRVPSSTPFFRARRK